MTPKNHCQIRIVTSSPKTKSSRNQHRTSRRLQEITQSEETGQSAWRRVPSRTRPGLERRASEIHTKSTPLETYFTKPSLTVRNSATSRSAQKKWGEIIKKPSIASGGERPKHGSVDGAASVLTVRVAGWLVGTIRGSRGGDRLIWGGQVCSELSGAHPRALGSSCEAVAARGRRETMRPD